MTEDLHRAPLLRNYHVFINKCVFDHRWSWNHTDNNSLDNFVIGNCTDNFCLGFSTGILVLSVAFSDVMFMCLHSNSMCWFSIMNNNHHHQFNTHECSMNNKIHDRAHTIIQKDTKRRITQTKRIQKNKTKNCP